MTLTRIFQVAVLVLIVFAAALWFNSKTLIRPTRPEASGERSPLPARVSQSDTALVSQSDNVRALKLARVTTATFEPVYRSAKAIQAATVSGVSYVKFRELMQGLATEIGIAKDHPLNEYDLKLIALYEEAFAHYKTSATLWMWKIDWPPEKWDGDIPVWFVQKPDSALLNVAAAYDLPVTDHSMYKLYKTIPGDSVQRIWKHADAALDKATVTYYGKEAITQP